MSQQQKKTVIILGAGASAHAGAPLMNNFLDQSERLLQRGRVPEHKAEFERVFEALEKLKPAQAKATINLDGLEAAYNALEFASLLASDDKDREDWSRACDAMAVVISRTLEETVRFPVWQGAVRPTGGYDRLVEVIKNMENPAGISILTFNYDIALEAALIAHGVEYVHGLLSEEQSRVEVLKLHGSIHWAGCSACGVITPLPIRHHFGRMLLPSVRGQDPHVIVKVSKDVQQFTHCPNATPARTPMIVPPTLSKSGYHATLATVWRRAAARLRTAENILVCGFSLPPTDQFFNYLFAVGTMGRARVKRFWVFDPADVVEERFRVLAGQATSGRFQREAGGFEVLPRHLESIMDEL